MNVIIGLTGPTGSGKSSASKACLELGLKLVDCDKIARIAVEKDSDGLRAVVSAFGKGILNTDGTLNRKALAKIAFSSREKTALLNDTIFPFIKELVLNETKQGKILLDAPTLFESGTDSFCDVIVSVVAEREDSIKRIMLRDNLSREEAENRLSSQHTAEFYREKSDFCILNNGTREELKDKIISIFQFIGDVNEKK